MTKFDDLRHQHNLKEFDDKIAEHEAEIHRLHVGCPALTTAIANPKAPKGAFL